MPIISDHWSGMLGYLSNGTADMLAHGTIVTTELRMRHFYFAYPLLGQAQSYFFRRPSIGFLRAASLVYSTFEMDFWLLTAALVATLFLLSRCDGRNMTEGILSWIGCTQKLQNQRGAAVLLGFFLSLISGLFQAKLLTQLLIITPTKPFPTLEGLIEQISGGNLKLLVQTVNNAPFERINASIGYEARYTITTLPRLTFQYQRAVTVNPPISPPPVGRLLANGPRD